MTKSEKKEQEKTLSEDEVKAENKEQKEISPEIVEQCKKLGLDNTSIIKFYTISLKKIKSLTKKTKEKLKNIFQE